MIVLNALGLFADPHFALPVAPAFVLFGAGALLAPRDAHATRPFRLSSRSRAWLRQRGDDNLGHAFRRVPVDLTDDFAGSTRALRSELAGVRQRTFDARDDVFEAFGAVEGIRLDQLTCSARR